jgi:hypothetical protein
VFPKWHSHFRKISSKICFSYVQSNSIFSI